MSDIQRMDEKMECRATPEPTPCIEHDWKFVSDSSGDPNVIGGTFEFCYLICRTCGEECNDAEMIRQYQPREDYEE